MSKNKNERSVVTLFEVKHFKKANHEYRRIDL